jgi:hypothetical protein
MQKSWFLPAALLAALLAGLGCATLGHSAKPATGVEAELDAFNTVFNSPSKDEADSIPLGNGTTGINLWVEENGDLLFYLARNDAISEVHRLLKLGRIRVSLSPNPFAAGKPYRQELRLRHGCCDIVAGPKGQEVRLNIFVDSDSQTVYVAGIADQPVSVKVKLENWRTQRNDLREQGSIGATWIYRSPPPLGIPTWEAPDTVLEQPNAITWYHRNEHTPVPVHIKGQHLEASAAVVVDPILNRTFGASVFGSGFQAKDRNTLVSSAANTFDLRIATHAAQVPSADAFLSALASQAKQAPTAAKAAARTARWWQGFWNRSWVFVNTTRSEQRISIPGNAHPLRLGAASNGQELMRGAFGRASVFNRPLEATEIARLAAAGKDQPAPVAEAIASTTAGSFAAQGNANLQAGTLSGGFLEATRSTSWKFPQGLTLEAWIKMDALGGRIFDKITPNSANGFLFDSYGGKLRLIGGDQTLYATAPLPTGQWVHVAGVADTAAGKLLIYQDGKLVGTQVKPVIPASASRLTQAYILVKYQLACQERSSLPAHFNGGIFTVAPEFAYYATDPRGQNWSADYRFYGCNLWWQNTRFLYQLHLAQGSTDLMDSFFDFYFRHQATFRAKAKTHYNADGIYMNEVQSLFGLPGMGDFCWGAQDYSEGYTRNIWQQCLEFGAIALDRYDYTGDAAFLKKTISWCDDALRFYDTRFKKDAQGKIIIFPSHAVETYWTDVTNDMPSVAGLHEISSRLLALPPQFTTPDQRARWKRIQAALPPLPKTRNAEGLVVPDNAEKYKPERANYESPDLNCVYPFRLYGIGRTEHDIEEARRAWVAMPNPGHCCWYQTGIIAARLGLTEGAKEDVLIRSDARTRLAVADGKGRTFRFPGFFGSPHDWCPDYDGAGNMANTLQEMLLQPGVNGKLLLFPAWPKDWDVSFKLHAPGKTTVECEFNGGKITRLKVIPAAREKDVILPDWAK